MSPHLKYSLPLSAALWIGIIFAGRALVGPDAPPALPQATIGAGSGKPF